VLGLVLAGVAGAWIVSVTTGEAWKISTSLPLPLYDVAALVPVAALWWEMPLLVELTWFWGLAGSPRSLLSPDVQARFPTAEF
jgi:uncharacterized membrane protein YwaF